MFLELVDFSRSEAVRIVKILSNFKTESEAGYSKVVVEKVREYIEYYTASVSCNLIGQYCTSTCCKLLFSMEAHLFHVDTCYFAEMGIKVCTHSSNFLFGTAGCR